MRRWMRKGEKEKRMRGKEARGKKNNKVREP